MHKNNKRFVVDADFIKNASDFNLSFNEFVLMIYFDNGIENIVNIKNISKFTKLKETDIMLALSSLIEKKLVSITLEKNGKDKIREIISCDGFYSKIKETQKKVENQNTTTDIFSKFESKLGRTLSQTDYEIIKVWIDKLYNEDLILAALEEASYNGVSSLRYIDKILFDWNKKGFKNAKDIKRKSTYVPSENSSLLEYNWLDDGS